MVLDVLKKLDSNSKSEIHNTSWGFEGCHVTFKNDLDNLYELIYIFNLFDLDKTENNKEIITFENIKIINGFVNYKDMRTILKEDGFIFN